MRKAAKTFWRRLGLQLGLTGIWAAACFATAYGMGGDWPLARDMTLAFLLPVFITVWTCDRLWGRWIARAEVWKVLVVSPALYIAGGLTFAVSFIVLVTAMGFGAEPSSSYSVSPLWFLLMPFVVILNPLITGVVAVAMLLTIVTERYVQAKPESPA